ncbi:MAG: toll/interleukin-1 receptor domain-containing protein [Planctomycetes bacterium]|nr:toll/interleukin-1 receptor domain-containing protein [Planctomycetota bacterium]
MMKTGSRDVRHLINIYGANQTEIKKVREILATDSSLDKVEVRSLGQLSGEGIELDRQLSSEIDSTIAKVENDLDALQKASIKLWNKSSVDASVIPKSFFFFISHATDNKDVVVEITKELEAIGIATWRDDKDILGGDSIPSEIEKGLEKATHFGLLYTNASKDRAWVKTEFENALMLRARTGRPKIIPLLLDGLRPPTILGNIRGVPFDNFKQGMEQLWRSLGVPAGSRISLDVLFKFQQKARLAVKKVKWCHQSDRNLEVDEEEFDALEDIETYTIGFPIRGAGGTRRRFEWTVVSWPTERPEELRPSFECDFYTYRRAAIAGSSLLRSIGGIVERLLEILDKIDGVPLPREISGGA